MRRLAAPVCAFALALHATAQEVLHRFEGTLPQGHFGLSIARAGDLDGDGHDELIVGSGGLLPWSPISGAAAVYRHDGTLLHRFDGGPGVTGFGISVSGAGDVNADGFDDVLVGAPEDRSWIPEAGGLGGAPVGDTGRRGCAWVYSGRDGALLHRLHGSPRISHLFGRTVGAAGDVDGDGHDDVLVSEMSEGSQEQNLVRVFSGADGAVLLAWEGSSSSDFGHVATGVGDLDGDGYDDAAVAAPFEYVGGERVGVVRIYSGRDGAVLRVHAGVVPYGVFGAAVAAVGDVDHDGLPEVAVGARGYGDPGELWIFSGLDGRLLLRTSKATSSFGSSVSRVGDVDGDGTPDVAVGDPGWLGGAVLVISGADGASIFRESTDGHASLGHAVCGVGDWNGDGFPDLAASLPWRKEGVVKVFDGRPRRGTSFCGPAPANSTGRAAEVVAHGSLLVQRNDLTLRATALPPGRSALFLVGAASAFEPLVFGSQGNLCLARDGLGAYRGAPCVADAAGTARLPIDLAHLPMDPRRAVLPGETWHFQCWYRDVNPSATSNLTDAVSVRFE